MNKGLDLIQRQQPEFIDGYPTGNVYVGLTAEESAELEKELKALEIIKEKKVNVYMLLVCFEGGGLEKYNYYLDTQYLPEYHLSQEQFDSLKEALQ